MLLMKNTNTKIDDACEKILLEADSESSSIDKGEIELRFSEALISEFADTVNAFTQVCSQMTHSRSVDKDTYDKFSNLMSKIKNLTEAAKNSIS